MVFHTNPCIKILIFLKELLLNPSLAYLTAQIACYELKGDLSPVMLKEIFQDSFENLEITRIFMEKHAIASFEIYGWKFAGYLI